MFTYIEVIKIRWLRILVERIFFFLIPLKRLTLYIIFTNKLDNLLLSLSTVAVFMKKIMTIQNILCNGYEYLKEFDEFKFTEKSFPEIIPEMQTKMDH